MTYGQDEKAPAACVERGGGGGGAFMFTWVPPRESEGRGREIRGGEDTGRRGGRERKGERERAEPGNNPAAWKGSGQLKIDHGDRAGQGRAGLELHRGGFG